MYFLHCKLCLCTPYLPLSLCPFLCLMSLTNLNVFVCAPSQIVALCLFLCPVNIHDLDVCRFSFPMDCECRSRRRQNTVSAVACCQALPRPLPVSAMLQANLFYTSFYRTVTSCLASSVFRRGYSRGSCHGHARSCFQSALSRPCFTGAYCTPRRSRRGRCLAACRPPPLASFAKPGSALPCSTRCPPVFPSHPASSLGRCFTPASPILRRNLRTLFLVSF